MNIEFSTAALTKIKLSSNLTSCMKLHEVATINAGYAFRSAIEPVKNGNLFVFQAKDIVQGESIVSAESLTPTSQEVAGYAGYLRKGDVLLVARGMKAGSFRATIFLAEEKKVIASSSVHVIRVNDSRVLPEFIALYLNSKEGQKAIAEIVSGSYIGAVPRKKLEQITIPFPPLEQQKNLVDLHENIRRQQKIMERQGELKQEIINAIITNLN